MNGSFNPLSIRNRIESRWTNEQKRKKTAKQKLSTRQLINTKAITDYSLLTYGHGELVYFIIKPTNISVLSEASIAARIYALMTVLKGMAEI